MAKNSLKEARSVDRAYINKAIKDFNKNIITFDTLVDNIIRDLAIKGKPKAIEELKTHLQASTNEDSNQIETNADEIFDLNLHSIKESIMKTKLIRIPSKVPASLIKEAIQNYQKTLRESVNPYLTEAVGYKIYTIAAAKKIGDPRLGYDSDIEEYYNKDLTLIVTTADREDAGFEFDKDDLSDKELYDLINVLHDDGKFSKEEWAELSKAIGLKESTESKEQYIQMLVDKALQHKVKTLHDLEGVLDEYGIQNAEFDMKRADFDTIAKKVGISIDTAKKEYGTTKLSKAVDRLEDIVDRLVSIIDRTKDDFTQHKQALLVKTAADNLLAVVEYYDEHLTESKELTEKLTKANSASEWIHDFVNSDNPMFDGKSKEERKKMALAAYYAAQKE
jgi:hypothetical protein